MEPDLACLPFNPGVEGAFGIGKMDSDDADTLVSQAEFKAFLVDKILAPILSAGHPRSHFRDLLNILLKHARGIMWREQALAGMAELELSHLAR